MYAGIPVGLLHAGHLRRLPGPQVTGEGDHVPGSARRHRYQSTENPSKESSLVNGRPVFVCVSLLVHYDSHLLIYSETHVDVLDCSTGDWIQTLNLKRCRPLTSNGLLSACFATEQPYVVYLRNTNKGAWDRGVRRGSNAPALSLVVGLLIGFETSQHRL